MCLEVGMSNGNVDSDHEQRTQKEIAQGMALEECMKEESIISGRDYSSKKSLTDLHSISIEI